MPLAVYLAMETDPDAAIALSLVLLAVSVAVLFALRGRWLGAGRCRVTRPSRAGSRTSAATVCSSRAPCAAAASSSTSRSSVAPGEVLGVLGPNGAGKSTLLRAVAGLEELSSGRSSVGVHAWQRPGRVRARRASAGRGWSSRTTGCSRTSTCATTSPSPRGRRDGRARSRGPRRRSGSTGSGSATLARPSAAPALRRSGPAGGAGPGAGPRARGAAARRADGRAGRRGPDRRTRVPARAPRRLRAVRSCWSPTTRSRRWCWPTGCW